MKLNVCLGTSAFLWALKLTVASDEMSSSFAFDHGVCGKRLPPEVC